MRELLRNIDLKNYNVVPIRGGLGESVILKIDDEVAGIVCKINGRAYLEPASGPIAFFDEHEEVILKNK